MSTFSAKNNLMHARSKLSVPIFHSLIRVCQRNTRLKSFLAEQHDVLAVVAVDETFYFPTSVLQDLSKLIFRNQQVIKPTTNHVFVSHSYSQLSGHPASLFIQFVIRQMHRVFGGIGISRHRDNQSIRRRYPLEFFQKGLGQAK